MNNTTLEKLFEETLQTEIELKQDIKDLENHILFNNNLLLLSLNTLLLRLQNNK